MKHRPQCQQRGIVFQCYAKLLFGCLEPVVDLTFRKAVQPFDLFVAHILYTVREKNAPRALGHPPERAFDDLADFRIAHRFRKRRFQNIEVLLQCPDSRCAQFVVRLMVPLAIPQIVQTSVFDRRKQVGRNMFRVHRRTAFQELNKTFGSVN